MDRREARIAAEQRRRLFTRIVSVLAIALGIGVIIAVPAAVLSWEFGRPSRALDEGACSATVEPLHVVVIIDQTDELSQRYQAVAIRLLQSIGGSANFPELARLTVYTLTPDPEKPLELRFSMCRPPDPSPASGLLDTPEDQSRREELAELYEQHVKRESADWVDNGPQSRSPLMQAFSELGDQLLQDGSEARRLIVVSDMLQHTPELSHLQGDLDYDAFARSPEATTLQAYLRVDDVKIYYMKRSDQTEHQGDDHRAFWEDYFAAAGVGELSIVGDPIDAIVDLEQIWPPRNRLIP